MIDAAELIFKKTKFNGLFKITTEGDKLHFAMINLCASDIIKVVCTPFITVDMRTRPMYTLSIYTKDGGFTGPVFHHECLSKKVCEQILKEIGLTDD
jgi:hypothetical protein